MNKIKITAFVLVFAAQINAMKQNNTAPSKIMEVLVGTQGGTSMQKNEFMTQPETPQNQICEMNQDNFFNTRQGNVKNVMYRRFKKMENLHFGNNLDNEKDDDNKIAKKTTPLNAKNPLPYIFGLGIIKKPKKGLKRTNEGVCKSFGNKKRKISKNSTDKKEQLKDITNNTQL